MTVEQLKIVCYQWEGAGHYFYGDGSAATGAVQLMGKTTLFR